ncbi:MAG TPA: vWA domain-containing protein [Gaiellaceae bacterium]|nr:vWA domain-containing protein [Gaiellaceae bacterium]
MLPLVVIALVPLLGMLGLALDIGYAYYSQRTLQSSADAAALAGASQLPDLSGAAGTATSYGAASGGKNAIQSGGITGVTQSVSEKCVTSLPGCAPDNAVVVDETGNASTFFLRLFGVSSIPIHVRSTACGPCADRPADIVVVFDRTGSMCWTWSGAPDPSCTKLNNAKSGIETMLTALDPTLDRVGLVVLPPVDAGKSNCATPSSNSYNSTSSKYVVVPITNAYKKGGVLDHSSPLVSTVDCMPASGATSYATALEQAQAELVKDGRPTARHYIVFFTDGAANTGPSYYANTSPYRMTPCHQGVASANTIKAAGTTIFGIGYTLQGVGGTSNTCQAYNGTNEAGITAYQAVQGIASNAQTFFDNEQVDGLDAVFASVATLITGPRLIPNDLQ